MKTLLFIPEIFGVNIEVYFILLLIGVLSFFFWRWLLKKLITIDKTRRTATWIATILLTPLMYGLFVMFWMMSATYYPSNDFNKEKWHEDIEKRYELSEDLIDSEILIGKTKKEVKKILGDTFQEWSADNWSYYLGSRPGIMDPDYLDIEFKDGRVVKVRQHSS